MSNAIQKVDQFQVALDVTGGVKWTRELVDLCKRTVCPKGITDDEFSVFMEQCRASGLNPFTKEAYCVPRKTKGANNDYITVHTFQASIGGARSRAGRFPDFHSSTSAAVYERDQCEVDADAGVVRHKFNPCAARGALRGAWGKVTKTHGPPILVWLSVGDRAGNSNFWRDSPGMMLAKCAEFAALCKAYPVQFTGMELEDGGEATPTRAQEVLSRLDGPTLPPDAASPPPAPEPVVEFGEWKGTPISSLTLEQAEAAASFALAQLGAAKPGAKWVAKLEANLALVQDHRDMLAAAPPAPRPAPDVVDTEVVPEPGSEG